jgi:branched-chain amino acid transport system permease protein
MRRQRRPLALGLVACAFLIAPFLGSEYWQHLLVLVTINLLVVVGLHLLTGLTGQLSFGQAAFMGTGAYAGALLLTNTQVPYVVGALAAVGGATVLALMLGPAIVRLVGDYFVIATIGIGEVVYLVLLNSVGITGGPLGISGIPPPALGPLTVQTDIQFYYVILALDAGACLLIWRLNHSRVGRALIAVRDDELAARFLGVRVRYYKVVALAISAGFAGLAGLLFGSYASYISPDSFGYTQSIGFAIMVILGGLGSMSGAVVGAILVTLAPEGLRALGDWRLPLYGAVLVAVMVVRPQGLFGKRLVTGGPPTATIRRLGRRLLAKSHTTSAGPATPTDSLGAGAEARSNHD